MTTTVSIPGMHCDACAKLIQSVSEDFPAISKADVDLETLTVRLEHDANFALEQWKQAVEDLGDDYRVHINA